MYVPLIITQHHMVIFNLSSFRRVVPQRTRSLLDTSCVPGVSSTFQPLEAGSYSICYISLEKINGYVLKLLDFKRHGKKDLVKSEKGKSTPPTHSPGESKS